MVWIPVEQLLRVVIVAGQRLQGESSAAQLLWEVTVVAQQLGWMAVAVRLMGSIVAVQPMGWIVAARQKREDHSAERLMREGSSAAQLRMSRLRTT